MLKKTAYYLILFILQMGSLGLLSSCGQKQFLADLTATATTIKSGDILVLSGGIVARTVTPFPLHQIAAFNSDGTYKSVLRAASATELFMGMSFGTNPQDLLFTVDTTDRVDKLNIYSPSVVSNHIIDGTNLTGATLRTLATLSDGGTVVAESTTSIEKYDSTGNRIAVNFPLTLTLNIMKLRKISGGRFAAITNGGVPDSPRIYNNNGTLATTISMAALACTTNCDPSDILELSDGRFLVATQAAALHSIQLYSSSFAYIGVFFIDTTILQNISALAQAPDGSVIACNTNFNSCEKLQIVGSTGVRVGSRAFIDSASLMRQPTDVLVVP